MSRITFTASGETDNMGPLHRVAVALRTVLGVATRGVAMPSRRSVRRTRRHAAAVVLETLEDRALLSASSATSAARGAKVLEGRQLLSHLAATKVTYYNASGVGVPVIAWQGLRGADAKGQYLISGTSGSHGLLFVGSIAGKGQSYFVDDPLASSTSVYGPAGGGVGRNQFLPRAP